MPASILQVKTATATSTSNTVTATFDSATTTGSTIVVFALGNNSTSTAFSSLTDNRSGTYVQQVGDPMSSARFDLRAFTNVTGTRGATHSVTVDYTAGTTNDSTSIMMYEVAGVELTNPTAGTSSRSLPLNYAAPFLFSGNPLTPTAYGLHLACAFLDGGGNGNITPGDGWTEDTDIPQYTFMQSGTFNRAAVPNVTQTLTGNWNNIMDDGGVVHLVVRDGLSIYYSTPSLSVGAGNSAYLQVVTQGATSYQWQDNRSGSFANVIDGTGGTTANYVTAALTTGASGRQYRCQVSDGTTTLTSTAATITVDPATTGSLGQFDPELRLLGWW